MTLTKVFPADSTENSEDSSTSLVYLSVESQDYHPSCRMCWESFDNHNKMTSPCLCKGTQKYVHIRCLRRWQENVQKRNINDERAYRCGVCQTLYTLPPPTSRWTSTTLSQLFGILCAVVCITFLSFILAAPLGPPLFVLILYLLSTRSSHNSLYVIVLLLTGTILATLHVKGLQVVLRNDSSHFGVCLIRHGAPIRGIGAGTLLVASTELDHSIFSKSVVLIFEHDAKKGARGVILNQPLNGPLPSEDDLHSIILLEEEEEEEENEEDVDSEGEEDEEEVFSSLALNLKKAKQKKKKNKSNFDFGATTTSTTTGGGGTSTSMSVLHHRLGGPVGMPGEGGVSQEIVVLHSVPHLSGASPIPLHHTGDDDNDDNNYDNDGTASSSSSTCSPPLFYGGRLSEILEGSAKLAAAEAEKEEEEKGGSERSKGKNGRRRLQWLKKHSQQRNKERRVKSGSGSVFVFHGVSTWVAGQLEGEIRAHAWAFGDAKFDDVVASEPEVMWAKLMDSGDDRFTMM